MQILGTVQGDCNTLDRLMIGGIEIPLTLPDEDCNPKGLQSPCGHIQYTLCYRLYSLRPISPTQLLVFSVFIFWRLKSFDT